MYGGSGKKNKCWDNVLEKVQMGHVVVLIGVNVDWLPSCSEATSRASSAKQTWAII